MTNEIKQAREALDGLYGSGMSVTKEELCLFINLHGQLIRELLTNFEKPDRKMCERIVTPSNEGKVYRVRRGAFGKSILQETHVTYYGNRVWTDVRYDEAPLILADIGLEALIEGQEHEQPSI